MKRLAMPLCVHRPTINTAEYNLTQMMSQFCGGALAKSRKIC